jgi:hypothetical protein
VDAQDCPRSRRGGAGGRVAAAISGHSQLGDLVANAVRAHLNGDGMNLTEMQLLRPILDGDTPPQPTTANRCLDVLANRTGPAAGRQPTRSRSAWPAEGMGTGRGGRSLALGHAFLTQIRDIRNFKAGSRP